jgi:SPP1 family predicted phage head-tail adaptor
MTAGLSQRLRHRLTLQEKVETQDPDSGAFVTTWQDVETDIPASIEPLSAREFLVAQQMESKVTARIVMRTRTMISHDMRLLDRATMRLYNIEGVLTDKDSGLEYITLPVSAGTNDGR